VHILPCAMVYWAHLDPWPSFCIQLTLCPPNLVLLFMVMIYEPQPITWSIVNIYKKSDTNPVMSWIHHLIHILWHLGTIGVLIFARGGTSASWVLPWQSRSLTECSLIRKPYVHVMTTDAGFEQTGYFYVTGFFLSAGLNCCTVFG